MWVVITYSVFCKLEAGRTVQQKKCELVNCLKQDHTDAGVPKADGDEAGNKLDLLRNIYHSEG